MVSAVRRRDQRKIPLSILDALRSWKYAKAQPTAAVRRKPHSAVKTGACLAAMLLLVVPLFTLEADARGGGGGHGGGGHGGGGHGGGGHGGGHGFGGHGGGRHFGGFGGHRGRAAHLGGAHIGRAHVGRAHIGRAHVGRARIGGSHIAARSVGGSRAQRAGVAASRLGGAGHRFAAASAHMGNLGRGAFGNRAIANVALQSQFPQARFQGGFSGSSWPWWRGGLVLGWFGPVFWPYAYYDLFDYIYWPYAYDDFWPYDFDDVY